MKWVWRVLGAVLVVAVIAGIGFYLRPVSCFNAMMYLHEEFSGIESRSIRVQGYRVHYLAEGPANGPVVVLVHGLGASAEDWHNLTPYLVNAGFRVYCPDLPGYGRSERPKNFSYSVRDEAGVVVSFLDALGLKQVDLGGWSMGGWIVELIAADAAAGQFGGKRVGVFNVDKRVQSHEFMAGVVGLGQHVFLSLDE